MNSTDQTGAAVPGRTALVVDDSAAARHRIATLLQLGGWRVHQTVGTDAALRLAAVLQPDLVVTDMAMRYGHGATLMRRLREQGSTAHFVVVTKRRTSMVRALAAGAGALACLAKPVDPRLFVDVMRGLAPAAASLPQGTAPDPAPLDEGARSREDEMYVSALPHRLASIATSAQQGDAASVAVAADVLATASARLGHAEIAFLGHALAEEARRGVVAHSRLMTLVSLCARMVDGQALAGQVLVGQVLVGQAATSR
jgi:DNA-binding response OmpR family regulator